MMVVDFARFVLLTIVVLTMSAGGIAATARDTNDIIHHSVLPQQVKPSVGDDTYAEPKQVEIDSFSTDSSPQSTPANHERVLTVNDPYLDKQWGLDIIHASGLWKITTGSREILVAILDTGIDNNHEDINGQIVAQANLTDSPTSSDINGHGTHIAGIIAAKNNSIGIVGLAFNCRLLNIKVVKDWGGCDVSTVAKGIIQAVDEGADVINISLYVRESLPQLEEAVNYAWNHGAIIVAAAGNNWSQSPVYPAYYENCIAVAALGQDDKLAALSNYGDWVDVAAPGCEIYSTLPDNAYGYQSGTSSATAYVSGLAALLFGVVTDTNGDGKLNDEVRAAIENGCQEIGVTGVGRGRVDAAKAYCCVLRINGEAGAECFE